MKRSLAIAMAAALGVLGISARAQAQEEGPYLFATYYTCDQNREGFTDQLEEHVFGPRLDTHVEAGHLTSWGWLSHRIGGAWRRVEFMSAPDRATLLQVRNALIEEGQGDAELRQAQQVFTDICPGHDDYIYRVAASSDSQTGSGVTRATYFECDAATESEADDLLTEAFAPILNRHVGEGAFTNWVWLAHDTGGKIRRVLVFGAADGPTLYAHHDAMLADLRSEAAKELTEFQEICESHVDYQWDVTLSRP
ncbi:MAG: hypothetical protein ACE5HP_12520 [Gemmatimonadota bacterium]